MKKKNLYIKYVFTNRRFDPLKCNQFLPHFSETWSIGYILTKVEFTYQTKGKYEIQYAVF